MDNEKKESDKRTAREEKIAQEVAKLIASAKDGKLNEDEINEKLARFDLDVQEIENVFTEIEAKGITIEATTLEEKMYLDSLEGTTDDSVKMYLKDIGQVPLLSSEEEIVLAEKMAKGDQAAKDRLSEANLRLVVSIAKRRQPRTYESCRKVRL